MDSAAQLIAEESHWGAPNYEPLAVVISRGQGAWVEDVNGRRYLDCLSAYSALNYGHCHPRLVAALVDQAQRLTLTSRAFHNDQLPAFCKELSELIGMEMVLPMNTGVEAVETAIKVTRRWGYRIKGIPSDQAEIVVCDNNFHGRTTTVVGFSSEPAYRSDFGPFTPGFRTVPYGDIEALKAAIGPHTCGFLFEPIQCEGGVLIPPPGYLKAAADLCRGRGVLLVADEIQTGLGRTGRMLGCDHEGVKPDIVILGKALAGGLYPVSAVASRAEILSLMNPGSHGSTFGGNPLGCAVAREALRVLRDEGLVERSAALGNWLLEELANLRHGHLREVRGRGLLIGIELDVRSRPYCEQLMEAGMLCKETHDHVIRLAPPLITSHEDLEWALGRLRTVLAE
ncbi:MAG TPA: ornithine--oxo-acid transaminase [Candidatus Dormibacteraeota bacterium]|nr:ornithine--oxo-acid transaminase [Candidatus Dormibacteraeota bacterium]